MRLNAPGLDGFFDLVVAYEDSGRKKPNAAPFKKILEELGDEAGECLMVGDWPDVDLVGAKAIGMKTCWAKYGSRFEGGEADIVAEEFEDIIASVTALESF
jgi:putative hydrolase of the HAD superfamily